MTPEPEWVDLGLPSGLLWSKFNLGATVPESPGIYFSWGNIDGHPAGAGYDFSQEVYNTTPAASIDADLTLDQDAARANLGAPWRMPTAAEFQELYDNCTNEWTTFNGVYGRMFTSNVNGKTLFLPAAGFYNGESLSGRGSSGDYWSSSFTSSSSAKYLNFSSVGIVPGGSIGRNYGFPIRAVRSA